MIDEQEWIRAKQLCRSAFSTSSHFAIASVDEEGTPHVTPIGSVLLAEPGHALYFEIFAGTLGRRLAMDPRVSVLAVNSSMLMWLGALVRGRFLEQPALRLVGRAATETREASEAEIWQWQRLTMGISRLRGGRMLWSRLERVRDLWIDRIEYTRLGGMIRQLNA